MDSTRVEWAMVGRRVILSVVMLAACGAPPAAPTARLVVAAAPPNRPPCVFPVGKLLGGAFDAVHRDPAACALFVSRQSQEWLVAPGHEPVALDAWHRASCKHAVFTATREAGLVAIDRKSGVHTRVDAQPLEVSCVPSSEGVVLYDATEDTGSLSLWMPDGTKTLLTKEARADRAWSHDGRDFAFADVATHEVRIVDATRGEVRALPDLRGYATSFVDARHLLALTEDQRGVLVDVQTGAVVYAAAQMKWLRELDGGVLVQDGNHARVPAVAALVTPLGRPITLPLRISDFLTLSPGRILAFQRSAGAYDAFVVDTATGTFELFATAVEPPPSVYVGRDAIVFRKADMFYVRARDGSPPQDDAVPRGGLGGGGGRARSVDGRCVVRRRPRRRRGRVRRHRRVVRQAHALSPARPRRRVGGVSRRALL